MPLWSMAGLPFCGVDRGGLLWGRVCHHVKREASRLYPIYALCRSMEVSMQTRRLLNMVGFLISLVIAAELSVGPQTALAGAKIYWTEELGKIQRANPD